MNQSGARFLHSSAMAGEIRTILESVRRDGWERAYFSYTMKKVKAGEPVMEDERVADWTYLISGERRDRALVVGCGLGNVPIALARTYAEVVAVDSSADRVEILKARGTQIAAGNILPLHCSEGRLPGAMKGGFDLVALSGLEWVDGSRPVFGEMAMTVIRHLRPGGVAKFSVANRFSAERLLGGTGGPHGCAGYERWLRRAGFDAVATYAALPRHEGIPLFYVPLGSPGALRYFFSSVVQLFDMVSPEVKAQYGIMYRLARTGAKAANRLGLARCAKHFFPGFLVVAQKGEA